MKQYSFRASFLNGFVRGPSDHIDMRILHPGCKAQDKGYSRNHGLCRILMPKRRLVRHDNFWVSSFAGARFARAMEWGAYPDQ